MRIGDWVLIHGHANERDPRGDRRRSSPGRCSSARPEWDLGYRMASLLVERMPSVERSASWSPGTETNLLALRLARAHTGRTKLAKATGSYHGIADVLVVGQLDDQLRQATGSRRA